jgi:hypothetical protein
MAEHQRDLQYKEVLQLQERIGELQVQRESLLRQIKWKNS